MQDATIFWDRIAPKYAKSPVRDQLAYETTLARTRSYLGAEDFVLELGCGTGSTALILADAVKKYTATDLSPAMIEIGRRKATEQGTEDLRFVAADVFDPILDGERYDVVTGFNLFHLLAEPDAAMRRVNRLLKPGGLFISKTPCPTDGSAPLRLKLMLHVLPVMQLFGKAPFVKFQTIAELERSIVGAGFKIIEVGNYPVSPPNHFVVARKV
jgi:ubiquinone/menaquinone biosynthesis C-methylase UbiE